MVQVKVAVRRRNGSEVFNQSTIHVVLVLHVIQLLQRPYIDSVVPTYGPKSGGTMITMRGGFLGNTTMATASIGHLLCHRTDTSG